MNGTFPLARRILESDVWEQGALTVQVWMWILLNAVWQEDGCTMDDGRHVERGQLWTTYDEIAKAVRHRHGRGFRTPALTTIKDIVGHLNSDRFGGRMVDLMSTPEGILLTVCNYGGYNNEEWLECPVGRPVKSEVTDCSGRPAQEPEVAQVTFTRDDISPLEVEGVQFLAPADNFDLPRLMAEFRRLKVEHQRTRLHDLEVESSLSRLHCDPGISPRLGTEDLLKILGNWLAYGRPLRPAQLWAKNPHLDVPWWEACLAGAERAAKPAANGRPKQRASRDDRVREILAGVRERQQRHAAQPVE